MINLKNSKISTINIDTAQDFINQSSLIDALFSTKKSKTTFEAGKVHIILINKKRNRFKVSKTIEICQSAKGKKHIRVLASRNNLRLTKNQNNIALYGVKKDSPTDSHYRQIGIGNGENKKHQATKFTKYFDDQRCADNEIQGISILTGNKQKPLKLKENGELMAVFEHINGLDGDGLREEYLKNNTDIEIDKFIDYLYQLAMQLKKLHSHGKIHCDIKPANIMFCFKDDINKNIEDIEEVRLIDFELMQDQSSPNKRLRGTPFYFTPEQLVNYLKQNLATTPNDKKSDVWALGLSMLEIMFGQSFLKNRNMVSPNINEKELEKLIDNHKFKNTDKFKTLIKILYIAIKDKDLDKLLCEVQLLVRRDKYLDECAIDKIKMLTDFINNTSLDNKAIKIPFFSKVPATLLDLRKEFAKYNNGGNILTTQEKFDCINACRDILLQAIGKTKPRLRDNEVHEQYKTLLNGLDENFQSLSNAITPQHVSSEALLY